MEKITIAINGVGGCGKDTIVNFTRQICKVQNTSSITPILDVAKFCGWDGVKTDKSRKFLADLKQLLTDYNEMPLNYLLEEQQKFINGDDDVMFVHIREPHEIEKFKNYSKTKTYALLITPRDELVGKVYGNTSDDNVSNYNYDFTFANNKPLDIIEQEWIEFFTKNILKN